MTGSKRDVRDTYDRIASHFSKTRRYAWPEVESFVDAVDSCRVAVDVGCGNGRHTELLESRCDTVVGVDVSRGLLLEAAARTTGELVQGNAVTLPLASDTADVGLYVATIHHLPDRDTRITSLDEFARILTSGGRGLVSTWSTAHESFERDEGFDTTVDWSLPGGETVPRFYHIYSPTEFREDLESSMLTVESVEISSGNCYAVVASEK